MWVNSAVWKTGEDALVLVDVLTSRLREFRLDEKNREATEMGVIDVSGVERPSSIRPLGRTYMLQADSTRFVRLSEDFQETSSFDLKERSKDAPLGQIGSVFAWAPLGETALLTYSDLHLSSGKWTSAFLWVPLEDPAKYKVLQQIDTDSPARTFYLLGYPYVASSSSGKGFYVDMGGASPTLHGINENGNPMLVLKSARALVKSQDLPKKEGLKTFESLYRRLQQSDLVAGIYGYGEDLYLLRREPTAKGNATKWTIGRFTQAGGFQAHPYEIKTSAAHLTIIPGPTFAVLEKGPVEGVAQQAIPSVLLVPKGLIDSAH
jgi:hypothetical protein